MSTQRLPPPPPPPPPLPATLTVTVSHDYRGESLGEIDSIVFAAFDFARATFDSSQFGPGHIFDNVAITGDDQRDFIDVYLPSAGGSFSAAGWSFTNWVPFTPLQNDQVDIFGSASADTITGSSQADSLVGDAGDDILNGGAGRDYLIGGAGIDALSGGEGDDNYRLDDVHRIGDPIPIRFDYDTVIEASGGGTDTVELYHVGIWGKYTLPANVENGVVFGNIQNGVPVSSFTGTFTLFGNDLNNALTGNDDINSLFGGIGSDRLIGNGGNDLLDGGADNDQLSGSDGADTVKGGAGDDVLNGGSGTDILTGGLGRDILIGNIGPDQFDYNAIAQSGVTVAIRDVIRDFAHLVDDIDLSGIDAHPGGADDALTFIGTAAFTAEGQVRGFQSGADTVIAVNVSGTSGAEMEIMLRDVVAGALTAADFVL